MPDPFLSTLERRYNLPPGILEATRHVESGGRDVTSSAGAQGHFQLMPETARALGVDPHDPMQAANGAARLWRQNLDAAGGDIDTAARMYQGGPDRRKWGRANAAYPGQILAALQRQNGHAAPPSQDHFETALSSADPFEQALEGATSPAHDTNGSSGNAGAGNGAVSGNRGGSGQPGRQIPAQAGILVDQAPAAQMGRQGAEVGPNGPQAGASPRNGEGLEGTDTFRAPLHQNQADFLKGGLIGINKGLAGFADFNARYNPFFGGGDFAAQLTGQPNQMADATGSWKDWAQSFRTPDSFAGKTGDFVGQILPTLPVTEAKPLQALAEARGAGALAKGLSRYGDMSLQGGIAGAMLADKGHEGTGALMGAVLAPGIGLTVEKLAAPLAIRAANMGRDAANAVGNAVDPYLSRLAAGVKSFFSSPESMQQAVQHISPESQAAIAQMIDKGASLDDIVKAFPEAAQMADQGGLSAWVKYKAAGGKRPIAFDGSTDAPAAPEEGTDAPIVVTGKQLGAAIGSRASRSGIESTKRLPQGVADHLNRLREQGVPDGEALREADIRGLGAQPTVASVKRTPEDMRALHEGAKLETPQGRALAYQLAENNAAVHAKAQGMVQDYGGTPSPGDAAEASARSLAQASDAARAKISQAYEAARAQDGDKRIGIDAVREMLAKPSFKAPTTNEGRALVKGLTKQIEAMAKENGGRFTPDQIESLNQSVNAAYNPMGGGVNAMVSDLKTALNESLDQFDKAGPAFKQARAAHRQWAEQYDDPAGVERLIRRDAKGNFVNEDNWRAAENIVSSFSEKPFIQVVRQLKKVGAEEALNRLKATVVQQAYEAASRGAGDAGHNAPLSAQKWFDALNKVGKNKIEALFTPEEVADLAHVGRAAAHMNEAIPGTFNTSHTAATIINEMARQGKGASPWVKTPLRVAGHAGLGWAHPVVGNIAVEGAVSGLDRAANSMAANRLGNALAEQLDVNAARGAEAMRSRRIAEAMRRRDQAKNIAARTAPIAASERNER